MSLAWDENPEVRRLPAREWPGWFRDYVLTTIERDVVELSGIRKAAEKATTDRPVLAWLWSCHNGPAERVPVGPALAFPGNE